MELPDSGKIIQMTKRALQRISLTGIQSENAFYDKSRRQWLSGAEGTFTAFHVYFKNDRLPTGEIADAAYLDLSLPYWVSLNSSYVRPLDYAYLQILKTPLTQRLYEVLGLKFRGLKNSPYIRYDYLQLCQTLPITPQKSLKDAKKLLRSHHRKLQETGFINKFEWRGSQSKRPWEIIYWPGERARKELKRAREFSKPQRPALTDSQERLLDWILEVCGDAENKPAYRKIMQEYHEGLIETAIGETKQAKREHRIRTTAGAYFMDTLKRLADMHRQAHQLS
jgi:hypothetical protein